METDLDRTLWNVVDRRPYKKQPRDTWRCIVAGGNVNCQRPMGDACNEDPSKRETPLLLAIYRGMPKLVNILLKLGADPSAATGAFGDRTVLHIAAIHNRAEIAGMLIKAGVSMEKKDTIFGWTALHLAVYRCHRHHLMVRVLIAEGANVNAMDDTGRTPLQIALEYGGRFSHELKEILIENGAELSDKKVDGDFPDGKFPSTFLSMGIFQEEIVGKNWIKTLLKKSVIAAIGDHTDLSPTQTRSRIIRNTSASWESD
jgi:ankyrin repeat protein